MRKYVFLFLFLSIGSSFLFSQLNCSGAQAITTGTYSMTFQNGSETPIVVCVVGETNSISKASWYKFTPSVSGNYRVSTVLSSNSNVDNRISVFSGTCASLTCITGNDDFSGLLCQTDFYGIAGTTYYIVFDDQWSSASFNFELSTLNVGNRIQFVGQGVTTAGAYRNCAVDMNGDYLDDIVSVINGSQIQIAYQQATGGFTYSTINISGSANYLPSWSCAAGDYNKDGYNDLVLGGGNGVSFLKSNSTGTNYTVEQSSEYVFSQRSNFVDLNNDGHLDAFVCHDVQPNIRYTNNGSGTLIYSQGGMGDVSNGGNYGSVFIDYDNDGDQDLFIAKCRGGAGEAKYNELHRNDGNGIFTNVSIASNMRDPIQTWSSAWGDFNNDGFMDALVGVNSSADGMHKLMINSGTGGFSDMTVNSGWQSFGDMGREFVAHDFDNDGYIDVLSPAGKIMFNNGNLTFTPNTSPYPVDSYTGPIGDFNNDGFLDIQKSADGQLLINQGNSNKWIKITLKGIQSNSNGIGARVEIYGSWGKQIRDVQSGTGFEHMSTLNVHFGLGAQTNISKIVVRWPSGLVDQIFNVNSNQTVHVIEGSHLNTEEVPTNSDIAVIYPNPAKQNLYVSDERYNKADIYNEAGQLVKSTSIQNGIIRIEELKSGYYIITLTNGTLTKTEKFIKK